MTFVQDALPSAASAAYLHPSLSESFGTDGIAGSLGWGVPFGSGTPQTLRIDQSRHRLYVLKQYLWQCCNGENPPQPPRGIYAFDISTPGVRTPIPGFPITIANSSEPGWALDQEEGNIYLRQGTILYGWDPEGKSLAGFPVDISTPTGKAVLNSLGQEVTSQLAETGFTGHWTAFDLSHHVTYSASFGGVTALNESGAVIEQFGFLTTGGFGEGYRGIAVDEGSGTVYLLDDSDVPPENYNQPGAARGGKVRVWNAVVTPDVATGPPSAVSHATTVVTGHVDPAGGPGITGCEFQYGATTSYSLGSVPCTPAASPGSPIDAGTDVEAQLSGLTAGTEYHYRLVASNSNGQNIGNDETVIAQPSIVKTGAATEIARTTATLNGAADPEGEPSTFYFQYGTTRGYGKTAPAPPGEGVGTTEAGDQPVSEGIEGLEPGKTYHYRLVEVNGKGTSYGVDRTFTAKVAVKDLSTDPATEIHRADVTLNATMDPDGLSTHYYFEWGRNRRYGNTSAVPPGTELADSSPGDQHPAFVATGLKPETTYHYRVVAENTTYGTTRGEDRTFTTLPAVIGVGTDAASEVEPTTATLHGHLDPDGLETSFYFEWGKSPLYGHDTPLFPGEEVGTSAPGVASLSRSLDQLEPGTTYHYRLVGANSFGSTRGNDQSFKTPQGPSIEGVFSSDVSASGANLRARINPNGTEPSFQTTYRFEYGTTTAYGQSAPLEGGTLSPTIGGQNVSVPISGLSEVTYHFRVVAENQWGTATSEDQTFDFKAPSSCPNTAVRQQTGAAYLPDCRAYELVSPARAGGSLLISQGPSSPLAANRFAFGGSVNGIPGAGDPPNGGTFLPGPDLYVATRSNEGWRTRYVGIPATEAITQGGTPGSGVYGPAAIPADRTLSRFLTWKEVFGSSENTYSYAPYEWDNEGSFLGRLPSNLEEVPGATTPVKEGGFLGDSRPSGDFSHYAFSSRNLAFAPGGLTAPPGSAYDDDVAAGTVTLISKTASGADILQDGAAGTSSEYIRIPAVSRDGSHILMSTEAPGETTHLYLRVNDSLTYEVSEGEDGLNHGVRFAGMSEDGTEVFFTTAAQMTADDTDTSADLYRWSENGGSPTLTRLSVGSEGQEGNRDNCSSVWGNRCGVEVVPTDTHLGSFKEHLQPIDSSLASQGSAVAFYSPEQLEGARGVPGERNLYLWRGGAVQHVATLGGGTEEGAQRINVSPDGAHMAFVTKTRIGAYDNAGHTEMYTYEPATGKLTCVSCLPDGSPPSSDVKGSQNGNFMTDDGRAFFSTEDALVPRDNDGIIDVYEYVGGRAQLISTGAGNYPGEASRPIGLIGVSANGLDAFISTYETLVPQDENGPFLKFYDARTNGGIPFNKPPAPCAAADECHGEGSSSPPTPTIGSGAELGGGGNATQTPTRKATHRKHHRRHAKHRRHRRGRAGR